MKTFLNKPINVNTHGILYLCWYDHKNHTIEVLREIQYKKPGDALDAYANTPNPESQLAMGKTKADFEKELMKLHKNLNNPEWVKGLKDYL